MKKAIYIAIALLVLGGFGYFFLFRKTVRTDNPFATSKSDPELTKDQKYIIQMYNDSIKAGLLSDHFINDRIEQYPVLNNVGGKTIKGYYYSYNLGSDPHEFGTALTVRIFFMAYAKMYGWSYGDQNEIFGVSVDSTKEITDPIQRLVSAGWINPNDQILTTKLDFSSELQGYDYLGDGHPYYGYNRVIDPADKPSHSFNYGNGGPDNI